MRDGRWTRKLKAVLKAEAKNKKRDAGARKLATLNDTKLNLAAVEGESLDGTAEPLGQLTGVKKVRQQTSCSLLLSLFMRTRIA